MEAPLGEEANHEEEAGMMHSEEQQGETSSHGDVAGLPEGDIDLDADSIGEEVGDEDIDPGDDDWELNDTLLDLTGFVPQYRDLLTSMQDNDLLALQEAILNYQYRYRNDMWQYDIVYKKVINALFGSIFHFFNADHTTVFMCFNVYIC